MVQGDITQQQVEALVNAANTSLLGGGGVDGAIHRAAGPELLEECRTLKGCHTGEAKITRGYRLYAQWVIHTVGPIWRGGQQQENDLLKSCYQQSLKLASQYQIKTIAFPAISTGVYHFPLEQASQIALKTVMNYLQQNKRPEIVHFVCFDQKMLNIYQSILDSQL